MKTTTTTTAAAESMKTVTAAELDRFKVTALTLARKAMSKDAAAFYTAQPLLYSKDGKAVNRYSVAYIDEGGRKHFVLFTIKHMIDHSKQSEHTEKDKWAAVKKAAERIGRIASVKPAERKPEQVSAATTAAAEIVRLCGASKALCGSTLNNTRIHRILNTLYKSDRLTNDNSGGVDAVLTAIDSELWAIATKYEAYNRRAEPSKPAEPAAEPAEPSK